MDVIMSPKNAKEQDFSNSKACVFCNVSEDNELKYGKIYEYDGIVTHYYCLLLSSNMQQKGRDEEGILGFLPADIHKELNRGRKLNCTFCKKKGATLGCVNKKCKKVFHYPCGIKANTLHQFFGQFKSFCSVHRPKQQIELRVRSEASDHLICYICYEPVQRDDIYKTLWAPCCKKNAWFHRDCVQQLALSAGYFFKCPLCNNKKEFQKAMQECGIYVPSQDASWELVPNAFQELLYRHNRCDAENCLCPHGREHTNTNCRWDIVLCHTCGSQGVHVGCGKLKWMNPRWECSECSLILNKSQSNASDQQSQESILNEDSPPCDDDASLDVSAGRESPYDNVAEALNLPEMSLKPGPRSAKLKQLHQQVETITPDTTHTTLEQLNDILDEQQANQFSEEGEKRPTVIQGPPKNPEQCVITVDDDDDDATRPHQSSCQDVNTSTTSSGSSLPLMNIKITEVTSLPPEVFASVPDVSMEQSQFQSNMRRARIQLGFLDQRKPDTPGVVSRIVNRVNDCLDVPELCPKKPRMDENYIQIDDTPAPVENFPEVYDPGASTVINYQNGVNFPSSGFPSLNEQVMNTHNGYNGQALRMNHAKDSGLSTLTNSDGDAGSRSADELALSLGRNADAISKLSRVPKHNNERTESNTKLSNFDSGLSSESDRGRRCSDGGGIEKRYVQCPVNGSKHNESTGSNRFRLMNESLRLSDLKFRVCENNVLEITVSDDYKFKINVDSSKKLETVNNCYYFRPDRDLTKSSPVRRSRTRHHNRREDLSDCDSSTINLSNNNFDLKKQSDASDYKDSNKNNFLSSFNSTHSLRRCKNDKNELSDCCKYSNSNNNNNNNNNKDIAKENLVPDKFERQGNNNFDSLALDKKLSQFCNDNEDFPGTSRDNFRELSQFSINRRQPLNFTSSHHPNNNSIKRKNEILNDFVPSSYNIQCHVSIDLDRIQSLIDSKPNLFAKNNSNLAKTPSLSDLQKDFENRNNLTPINRKRRLRSKSDPSVYYSTLELDHSCVKENLLFDNKKKKIKKNKRRKKNSIDRYDYCR